MKAQAAHAYDAVVVLPWGALPLENDGVRSTNHWKQLHFQGLLEGLLGRFVGSDTLLRLPTDLQDLDARLAWVEGRVG